MKQVILGVEQLKALQPPWLREARIGLLVNQASIDTASKPTKDIVAEMAGWNLKALCMDIAP